MQNEHEFKEKWILKCDRCDNTLMILDIIEIVDKGEWAVMRYCSGCLNADMNDNVVQ